jgi:hypothetical protein
LLDDYLAFVGEPPATAGPAKATAPRDGPPDPPARSHPANNLKED